MKSKNSQKALLTECPSCKASLQFAEKEIDKNDNCTLTCANCQKSINYKIEWVS